MSKIFNLDDAEKVKTNAERTMYWLVSQALGASRMRVVVYEYKPNLSFDRVHYHDERESVYFILEGEAIVHLNGEEHTLGPNSVAYLSSKDIHGVVGTGPNGLKMLEAWTPAVRDTTNLDRPTV